ncbi:hypothetical protein [Paenibacillus taiwanensis]|uniref:hypothetical protein n=1 Tax=Paenibacillus taiwanensis TaxID=401638 RepID=UPI00041A5BE0|nr:hypothetical protein [Paenibacillus taiwanensis]
MKKWWFYILGIVIICSGSLFFLLKEPQHIQLNIPLPNGLNTVKGIQKLVETEVNKYFGLDQYHLSEVVITQKKENKGNLFYYYIEKNNENPKVLEAVVDTDSSELISIDSIGRNNTRMPYEIHLAKWKIDSKEAYNIARTRLTSKSQDVYNGISIMTNNFNNKEEWIVQLYNEEKMYWCDIDPYTGIVLKDGIRDKIK